MAVNVIDTLKPKNGGTFPVVEAVDVSVGDGNLVEALAEKADADALEETNTYMSLKANASDVETATANLQNQINEIVSPVTEDAEVQNARVGVNGQTYETLKERLDAENENLDAQIQRYFGEAENLTGLLATGAINTSTNPIDLTPTSPGTDYRYAVVNCAEGDVFRVIGTGARLYRMWTFVDSSNNTLTQSEGMTDIEVSKDVIITAPENAAKLIVNFRTVYVLAKLFKIGSGLFFDIMEEVDDRFDVVDEKMDLLIENEKEMMSDGDVLFGYYINANNGEEVELSSWCESDFIDVQNTPYVYLYGVQQTAYYDENKEFVGNFYNIADKITTETRFDIPSGCAYIRCAMSQASLPTAYFRTENSGYTYAFDIPQTIRVGATRQYKTLREGVAAATKSRNTTVIVDPGTYDLTTEFADEISQDRTTQYGICLTNGVHVIFSSGAKVTAIYTGSSTNVETYFAPFWATDGDFTLENADITSKNTRYCVHDEAGGTTGSYTHKYINCIMSHDNTTAQTNYVGCIGGGLGKNGYVGIVGCRFKSKRAETVRTPLASYHNNSAASSQSHVNVRDCYFDDIGTFRVTHYGSSTLISTGVICNCSLGAEPYIQHEAGSTGPENMELIAYMNEIRE